MNSFRKWLNKPKRDDPSAFARFYFADEELTLVAYELDSFDGRRDPERCSTLGTQLRSCQDKLLRVLQVCCRHSTWIVASQVITSSGGGALHDESKCFTPLGHQFGSFLMPICSTSLTQQPIWSCVRICFISGGNSSNGFSFVGIIVARFPRQISR